MSVIDPPPDRLAPLRALGAETCAPFIYTSEMRIKPEHVEEFRERFAATTEIARAQPGCVFIEAHESFTEPGVFITYGKWESFKAFEEQESHQPWFRDYAAATADFHAADRVVRLWTPLRP